MHRAVVPARLQYGVPVSVIMLFRCARGFALGARARWASQVTMSYIEVYNENIRDLLAGNDVALELREDPIKGSVVAGVSEVRAGGGGCGRRCPDVLCTARRSTAKAHCVPLWG